MNELTYTQGEMLEFLQKGGVKTYAELAKLLRGSNSKKAVGVVISAIRKRFPDIKIRPVTNVGYCISASNRDVVSGMGQMIIKELEKGPANKLKLQSKFWPASSRTRGRDIDCVISRLRRQKGAIISVEKGIVTLEGWKEGEG